MTSATTPRPRWLRRLLRLFTVLGAITFGGIVLLLGVFCITCLSSESVPERTILEVRLGAPLAEGANSSPLALLSGGGERRLHDVIDTIDRAAADDRVAGMVAYVDASAGGMAKAQELRDAVLRFRASGKFAYAHAESFGELGPGTQGYYLASAFDRIWLQPTGELGLVGFLSSSMFLKGTFEKLDVEVLGDRRREYKNAFNMYTERRYTEPHAEAITVLLEDMLSQTAQGIADGRELSEAEVRVLIEKGPYLAPAAVEAGLIDATGYRDEVLAAAREQAGEGAELLYAEAYAERLEPPGSDARIAVVYAVGGVARGPSGSDPISGDTTLGSDTVAAAIAAAVADESVAAIVLRVDSPGGSPVASDIIWRETIRAKEAGKPVVVSMGNVAASGGYYVAAGASKIVAQPGTITGSIGVFAGKPNVRKLWNKVGVTWDSVSTSTNALAYSQIHGYDEQNWQTLQRSVDQIYIDFKTKVADGRGLSLEQVETLAKGRVWSGVRAKEIGLVDVLGGLYEAVGVAKAEAGLETEATVELVEFPQPQGWFEQLFASDPAHNSESVHAQAAARRATVERWRAVFSTLQQAGLGPNSRGALEMPPLVFGGAESAAPIR